jgi:hypothetical protein
MERVQVPAPTAWPMIAAFGVGFAFTGLVTNVVVTVVGLAMFVAGAVGWFREVLPVEHREPVPVAPVVPVRRLPRLPAKLMKAGVEGHRARLPVAIYPYSAGLRGGIAGGVAMAVPAIAYGVIAHGSPWYAINLLAACVLTDLATADAATLATFNAVAFGVAFVIHAVGSILVGLLYGVMLPMLPRRPVLFASIVAPLLWTSLLWASLHVLDPVLNERIDWRWFIASQVAFGIAAGAVVARSERIATLQHLPLRVRAGIEQSSVDEA